MANTGVPGPSLWLSIILTFVGATLAAIGGWLAFEEVFELLTVDSFEVPGEQTRDLDPGEYEVYGLVAQVSIFDLDESQFSDRPTFFAEDVTVTNLTTNTELPVTATSSLLTIGRNTSSFAAVGSFEVVDEGPYTVSIASTEETRSIVGRSIQSSGGRALPWLIMLFVGAILGLVGLAMLLTGVVRRSRAKKQPGYPVASAPAGFVAPPSAVPPLAAPPFAAPVPGTPGPPPPASSPGSPPPPPVSPGATPPDPPAGPGAAPLSPPAPQSQPNQDPHQPDTSTPWD